MSVLAAVKVKGEGLTTALQALSLVWPHRDVRCVVAELNPAGGDLALRYGLLDPPNLATVAAADTSQVAAAGLPQFFQSVGEVSLLLAPASAEQTQASLGRGWAALTAELAAMAGADVLVDAGTLGIPALGNADVLAAADLGVVVVRPTLDAVVHLLGRVPAIPVTRGGLVALVVGEGPVTGREIEQESGLAVVGELPWDPEGAGMLMSGSWTGRALRHSRLLRWSLNVAEELCARLAHFPPSPGGPDVAVATPEPASGGVAPGMAVR
ncbi:MAG: hypothetical protein ACRDZ8_06580 [Acidimicrobiales bacterium]